MNEQTLAVEVVKEQPLPADMAPVEDKKQVTAAQAKVEAIADLTHSAYQKAGTLSLTKEESEQLQADFPDEAFKSGAAGKENLIYIEHAFLRDRFAKVFGMGQWAIITRRTWSERFELPTNRDRKEPVEVIKVYVEAMLVVRGCFVGEAIGDMDYFTKNMSQNYGDAVEGAKTAAFRRCAKEFGVGLQAWKKDWCQGWWDRKKAPGKRVYPPNPVSGKPPIQPPPVPFNTMTPLKLPTAETRKWMIDKLQVGPGQPNRKLVSEYFQKVSQLLPTEEIEDLPLRFVPNHNTQLLALTNCIANFEAGGDAVRAFDPHGKAEEPKKGTPPPKLDTGHAVASESSDDASDEPWYGIVVPVPHKGQKRDEYLKNPDTIGSLYDARHDDEDARKRLWGFVEHYEPKGWTKQDGTQMPPNKADIQFREALDQFSDWFESTHPDEKL